MLYRSSACMDLTPLVFECAFGFIASILCPWAVLRVVMWLLIPLVVTFLVLGPQNFSHASGEGSMIWLSFCRLYMPGAVASGVGSLLGYVVRRYAMLRS